MLPRVCGRGNRVISFVTVAIFAVSASFIPALALGDTLPSISFVDQQGATHRFDEFRGRAVAISFIYPRCPDPRECPLVTSTFAAVSRKLDPRTSQLVLVTLDPAY